jgi:Bacterial capsule synthesis protein PGA_cap
VRSLPPYARRRLRASLATCAGLAFVAACQGDPPTTDAHAKFVTPSATASATGNGGDGTQAPSSGGDITLEFAGDVHFMDRTAKLLADPATAFGPSITPLLSAADVTTLNLETAVTDRGSPQPKQFHFRTNPSAFDALRSAGVDAVTIANNHILDYGRIGLTDTLAAAKAKDFPVYGAGDNAAAAWTPWVTTVRGTRIAYLGVSDVQELASSWIATRRGRARR